MNTLIWIGLGIGLAVALIVEDSREWILEQLESGWESVGDIFSGAFEDISDISFLGLAFGVISLGTIYLTRNMMLNVFLNHFTPLGKIFWGGLTYLGCFVAGYFLGKGFENS